MNFVVRIAGPENMIAYFSQNRHSIARHSNRVQRLIFKNGVEDFIIGITAEWGLAQEHFVRQHTERPPIYRTSISLFKQDLHRSISTSLPSTKMDTNGTSGAINSGVPQKVLVV
jgi:hypothetical protein